MALCAKPHLRSVIAWALGLALSATAVSARCELDPAQQPSPSAPQAPPTIPVVRCEDLAQMASSATAVPATPIPCDRTIAGRIVDCAQAEAAKAQTHRASLDYIRKIYDINKCPILVCSISRFYYFRKLETDVVASQTSNDEIEQQQIRFSEQCISHPEFSLSPKVPIFIEKNLPGQRKQDRKTWKNMQISSAVFAGITLAPLIVGIVGAVQHGQPAPNMPSCPYGGINNTPCLYDSSLSRESGFISAAISIGLAAGLFFGSFYYKNKYFGPSTNTTK